MPAQHQPNAAMKETVQHSSKTRLKIAAALLSLFALSGCFKLDGEPQTKAVFVNNCDWTTTLLPLLTQGWRILSVHQPSTEKPEEKQAPTYVILQKP